MNIAKIVFKKIAFNDIVERGGKLTKSMLCYKPPKNVEASKIGLILSNGNINFQSEEAAVSYIRFRLLDSLKRPFEKQFERAITKKGTTILNEANGTKTWAPPPFKGKEILDRTKEYAIRDVELWHSHPDIYGAGKTAPLSPPDSGDLYSFNGLHLKKIVAMNSKGEINSMEIAEGYSPDKFNEFKSNFKDYMEERLPKLLPLKAQKRLAEIEKYFAENKNTEVPTVLKKEIEELEQLLIDSQGLGEGARLKHEFYKTANLYGMKYYTNFSNLK